MRSLADGVGDDDVNSDVAMINAKAANPEQPHLETPWCIRFGQVCSIVISWNMCVRSELPHLLPDGWTPFQWIAAVRITHLSPSDSPFWSDE